MGYDILLRCLSGALLALMVLMLSSCEWQSDDATSQGRKTGTFDLYGTVLLANHVPASDAKVRIRPKDYFRSPNSITVVGENIRDTVTDSLGHYRIEGLPFGRYALESLQGDSLGLFRSLAISTTQAVEVTGELAPLGKVQGFLVLPDSSTIFYVEAYGLEGRTQVTSGGSFTVTLAQGDYVLRLFSASASYSTLEMRNIHIVAGGDTLLPEINSADLQIRAP